MLSRVNLEDSWSLLKRNAAPGVDRVRVSSYQRHFSQNLSKLVRRLKEKRYRALPVRRVYIPKAGGKRRPLGIPAVEDKLVQATATRILSAIYEQDFLDCSFGYRPGRGARQAVDALRDRLHGKIRYVVEADIKGFFDNIDHDWLIRMLEQRVDDRAFLRLIRKWLRAGILESSGEFVTSETGTPQGGIVSPVLANIYLHYALDLWFEKVVKPRLQGEASIIRYADDFVCCFQYHRDAVRFYRVLSLRLRKFGLEVAEDKTRVLAFSRFKKMDGVSFEFLGFEYRWGTSRNGKDVVRLRTARKRFRGALKNLSEWCRENRSQRLRDFFPVVNAKVTGHYNYFGVIGNYASLSEFRFRAERILFRWLNRRSQRKSFTWKTFAKVLVFYQLPPPRITALATTQYDFLFSDA